MVRSLVTAIVVLSLGAAVALAQSPSAPIPLIPSGPPRSFEQEKLPVPEREPPDSPTPSPDAGTTPVSPGTLTPPPESALAGRIFCHQPVTIRLAERDRVPERYRGFLGIWSDAAWTPLLCAALVVENVAPDGTATILYAFGPIGSNARAPSGVLNGTGIVRDGELRFQNSDGSQFSFRPLYADLEGRLTTPQGQNYRTVFKKTP